MVMTSAEICVADIPSVAITGTIEINGNLRIPQKNSQISNTNISIAIRKLKIVCALIDLSFMHPLLVILAASLEKSHGYRVKYGSYGAPRKKRGRLAQVVRARH